MIKITKYTINQDPMENWYAIADDYPSLSGVGYTPQEALKELMIVMSIDEDSKTTQD